LNRVLEQKETISPQLSHVIFEFRVNELAYQNISSKSSKQSLLQLFVINLLSNSIKILSFKLGDPVSDEAHEEFVDVRLLKLLRKSFQQMSSRLYLEG
jgi:hypothetical protein